MIRITPLYKSPKGGYIICLIREGIRIFQSCSASLCRYSSNLHSAKKNLDILESPLILGYSNYFQSPPQRKTTLKWNNNGELSELDKARILSLLVESDLTECELTCDAA